ncbi:MAG: radical SAM protein [Mogibacterium sp.]|nr:radical SAM protein [Mogibacterium sp.]
MQIAELKRSQLDRVAQHRDNLRTSPHLRWLFFELTNRCNLRCWHCGSSCSATGASLTVAEVEAVLRSVLRGLDALDSSDPSVEDGRSVQGARPAVCLTGGEPMLHPDFFEIAGRVHAMGFGWGMTTNATLIDKEAALRLRQAGMSTVSVSLDGLEASHDALRQQPGAWRRAVRGLECLQEAGFRPQVTTVLHQGNFDELEPLYDLLCGMGITSWRPINVEPIGRACEAGDLLLTPDQFARLLSYIRAKRFDRNCSMEVTFGCSHYLGVDWERMVRDHYFLCGAGILTASVRSNGDICACLDVENRPELVQGNIRTDDFMNVWTNRFAAFRRDRTADCATCVDCPERFRCGGDATHTWDFEHNRPLLCYRDYHDSLATQQAPVTTV